MPYLIGLFTFLAVALALAGGYDLSRRHSRLARRLLLERDPYSQAPTAPARRDGFLERLEREALQAGVGWKRSFFLYCLLAGAAGGGLLMLSGSSLSGVFVVTLGALGPVAFVRYRARLRAEQFAQQLPTTLTLMVSVIRAGGTLYQAVRAVVRQAPEPIRSEFARAEQAMQLQTPAAEALERIRDRIGLPEFTSVVVACKVAGEAGADLDRILESIARELVEDRQFLKAMEAASAEGKASARIVTAIPFVVMALVTWRSPDYFGQALWDPVGRLLIAGSVAAIAIGWLLIRQITDVRNW